MTYVSQTSSLCGCCGGRRCVAGTIRERRLSDTDRRRYTVSQRRSCQVQDIQSRLKMMTVEPLIVQGELIGGGENGLRRCLPWDIWFGFEVINSKDHLCSIRPSMGSTPVNGTSPLHYDLFYWESLNVKLSGPVVEWRRQINECGCWKSLVSYCSMFSRTLRFPGKRLLKPCYCEKLIHCSHT